MASSGTCWTHPVATMLDSATRPRGVRARGRPPDSSPVTSSSTTTRRRVRPSGSRCRDGDGTRLIDRFVEMHEGSFVAAVDDVGHEAAVEVLLDLRHHHEVLVAGHGEEQFEVLDEVFA